MDLQSYTLALLVTFMTLIHLSCSEIFTSLAELEKVLYAEREVALSLREYIAIEEYRLELLKKKADDYEEHSRSALEDPSKHLSNPVNAFLLVKRFTSDWEKVVELIEYNAAEYFKSGLSEVLPFFPDTEDLSGAGIALLRLQDTYALPTEKLAKGQIPGVQHSPTFTAEDCFELGRVAYTQQDDYHTVLWMTEANAVWESETNKTVEKVSILDYLSFSLSMQGNVKAALNLTLELLSLDPDHMRAHRNKAFFEDLLTEGADDTAEASKAIQDDLSFTEEEIKNPRVFNNDHLDANEFQVYEALCRGEHIIHNPDAHKLTCRYRHFHPYFVIRPLKEEVAYLDPFIATYHDLLTDAEINKAIELASPKLARSVVYDKNHPCQLTPERFRISKTAWLTDEEDPLVRSISLKAKYVANLTLPTSEFVQAVNYGIGGQYEPHLDFARGEEISAFHPSIGNRIATALFYMTDVEAGGATVFTQIGVRLQPRKGSMALWYNLKRNGEGILKTQHAGCPVLTGTKWVCNKWFHERGQEFIRPCSLSPDE